MRELIHSINWPVAFFTTRLLLMIIGGACIISFACTLKPFFFVVFVVASVGGWSLLYLLFAGLAEKGRRIPS